MAVFRNICALLWLPDSAQKLSFMKQKIHKTQKFTMKKAQNRAKNQAVFSYPCSGQDILSPAVSVYWPFPQLRG